MLRGKKPTMTTVNPVVMFPVFQVLNDRQLHRLNQLLVSEKLLPKSIICKEGAKANNLYILYFGKVVVTAEDEQGYFTEITKFSTIGSLFGDEVLLNDGQAYYDTTVTSMTEAVVFKLPKSNVRQFLEVTQDLGKEMKKAALDKYRIKSVTKQMKLFESLPLYKTHLLGSLASIYRYNEGQILFKQGKKSNPRSFYIVVDGTAEILIGRKVMRVLKSLDYFGELGILTNKAHSATIRATSPLIVVAVSQKHFKKLFSDEAGVMAEVSLKVHGKEIELDTLIQYKRGVAALKRFCKTEYSQENIDFLVEVYDMEKYSKKSMDKETYSVMSFSVQQVIEIQDTTVKKKCEKICERFILDTSETQISMEDAVRVQLIDRFRRKNFSADMFDQAKSLIWNILENDVYVRFKKSPQFQELLQQVGLYAH